MTCQLEISLRGLEFGGICPILINISEITSIVETMLYSVLVVLLAMAVIPSQEKATKVTKMHSHGVHDPLNPQPAPPPLTFMLTILISSRRYGNF